MEVLEASVGGLALQQKALSQGGRQSPSRAGLGRESLLANHPGSDATGGLECDLNTKGRLCALGVPSPSFPVIAESWVPAEPAIWAARVLTFPGGWLPCGEVSFCHKPILQLTLALRALAFPCPSSEGGSWLQAGLLPLPPPRSCRSSQHFSLSCSSSAWEA